MRARAGIFALRSVVFPAHAHHVAALARAAVIEVIFETNRVGVKSWSRAATVCQRTTARMLTTRTQYLFCNHNSNRSVPRADCGRSLRSAHSHAYVVWAITLDHGSAPASGTQAVWGAQQLGAGVAALLTAHLCHL